MPLSHSQIATYRRCPKQYEYAFVKKIPRPISAGESFGASVHNALKRWGELEMEHRSVEDGVRDDQLKLFMSDVPKVERRELAWETLRELWHACFIVEGHASRAEADFQRERGESLLRKFYAWWERSEHDVVAVEKGFKWQLPDSSTIISGRFDRVERVLGGLHIIDFKTGAVRPQEQVDADLQLSIYALAAEKIWEMPVASLSLLFLHEDATTELETTRNASQLKDAQIAMHDVLAGLNTQDFRPLPTPQKCAVCPYRGVCPASMATRP